jgi:hypothetical protein
MHVVLGIGDFLGVGVGSQIVDRLFIFMSVL